MSRLHKFLEQFDGYIILDHLDDMFMSKEVYNRKYNVQDSKTAQYWSVDITLTSGEVRSFYVKARDKFEAMQKAKSYTYLAEINYKKGKYILLP